MNSITDHSPADLAAYGTSMPASSLDLGQNRVPTVGGHAPRLFAPYSNSTSAAISVSGRQGRPYRSGSERPANLTYANHDPDFGRPVVGRMSFTRKGHDMRNSRTASVAEISVHWGVKDHATVRRVLKGAKMQPASTGPARYRWADIWAFEGPIGWRQQTRRPSRRPSRRLTSSKHSSRTPPSGRLPTRRRRSGSQGSGSASTGDSARSRSSGGRIMADGDVQPGSAGSQALSGKAARFGASSADRPATYRECIMAGDWLKPP